MKYLVSVYVITCLELLISIHSALPHATCIGFASKCVDFQANSIYYYYWRWHLLLSTLASHCVKAIFHKAEKFFPSIHDEKLGYSQARHVSHAVWKSLFSSFILPKRHTYWRTYYQLTVDGCIERSQNLRLELWTILTGTLYDINGGIEHFHPEWFP